jgi:hypothetical protein
MQAIHGPRPRARTEGLTLGRVRLILVPLGGNYSVDSDSDWVTRHACPSGLPMFLHRNLEVRGNLNMEGRVAIHGWHPGKIVLTWILTIAAWPVLNAMFFDDEAALLWMIIAAVAVILTWRWLSGREIDDSGSNRVSPRPKAHRSAPSLVQNGDEAGGYELTPVLRSMMKEYGIPDEVIRRKYLSYSLALEASGSKSNWNDDVDDHARRIGALTEGEIQRARSDFDQAVVNRVVVALVSEGWTRVDVEKDESEEESQGPHIGIEVPNEIPVVGGDARISIPVISFANPGSPEEEDSQFRTASAGAANLLIPIILERAEGRVSIPIVRAVALDMVITAFESNMVPTKDTRGLFIGARCQFETKWKDWTAEGDPTRVMEETYVDNS